MTKTDYINWIGKRLDGRNTANIEANLPFFLRSIGILIELGLPFRKALEIGVQQTDGALKKEMHTAMDAADNGISVQKALGMLATRCNSIAVRRAIAQLISAYENGGDGNELKRLGDELLSLEQHKLKEHSAKSAMFGLLFIIATALLPVFFIVYAIAGEMSGSGRVSEWQLQLAMLVIFPAISILILLLSKALMPPIAFGNEQRLTGLVMAIPITIAVVGSLTGFRIYALAAAIVVGAGMGYKKYLQETRVEEIERVLPDALFSISGLPNAMQPERVFAQMERNGFGALSEEAGKSRRQLESNVSLESALEDLWKRNGSAALRRVAEIFRQMVATSSLNRMEIVAEDMLRLAQIKRERQQQLAMQKYTLIFGAVIVPAIARIALDLLGDMAGMIGSGVVLIAAGEGAIPTYLIIYAAIAGMAIADYESKPSVAIAYTAVMAVIGMATFYFIRL